MNRDRIVEVILRAKDTTANVIGRFRRNMRAVQKVVTDVTRVVVGGTAAIVGMVFGLQRLGAQGDKVLAVKRSFAKITGDETAALAKLRTASKGMVDDMQLMALHNQSLALGAAGTTDEFARQIDVVNKLARAQGLTLSEGLEKFTVGMARLSKLRLDDLGITLDVEKANERYAASLGRSVGSLTEAEKATAFRNAAMAKATELADKLSVAEDGSASATVRFGTAMTNLKNTLAVFVAESPEVAAFFDGMTDVIENLVDVVATGDMDLLMRAFREIGSIAGNAFSLGVAEAVQGTRGFVDKMIEALLPGDVSDEERAIFDRDFRGRLPAGKMDEIFDETGELAKANIAASSDLLAEIAAEAAERRAARGGGAPGAPSRDPDSGGVIPPLSIPGAGGGIFDRRDAFLQAHQTIRQRSARLVPIAPGQISGLTSAPGTGMDPEKIKAGADAMDEAGQVVAASMFGMAQAAVRGSDQVAESVVSMITQIAQSIPGVGGIFGTIIGGVGGLIGAAVGRNRDPVPVRMTDIDDRAASKIRDSAEGPLRVTTIIEQGGQEIERIERDLFDRSNRDEVVRFSRGATVGR